MNTGSGSRRRFRERHLIRLASSILLFSLACGLGSPGDRPAHWAQPIAMEGVPNLQRIDDHLFRSAQPTAEGMRRLREMGIRTVVNLRAFHSDRDEIGTLDLDRVHIPMVTWHPSRRAAVRFLRIVTDPDRIPVLVHCQHGADRTGALCALYRVAVQDWTKEEAIREMVDGGYGFHGIWRNLLTWIRRMHIGLLRRDAGLGDHGKV